MIRNNGSSLEFCLFKDSYSKTIKMREENTVKNT